MKALLLALMAVIAVSGPAHADGDPLSISQFHHSRWDVMEGGPSLAIAVSQAPDGFLWIVSADGLSRFDGVGFESFTSRQNPDAAAAIRSLLTTRSGGVWVGLGEFGGVWTLRDGELVDTHMPDPPIQVTNLAEDHDGVIWAATARLDGPLQRYVNGRWSELGPSWGLPEGWVFDLLVTRDGVLWVAMMDRILVLPRGAKRFVETSAAVVAGAGLAEGSNGRVWLADRSGVRRLPDYLNGAKETRAEPAYAVSGIGRARIRFAPDGSLWGVTRGDGIFRIQSPDRSGTLSRYRAADGLGSDSASDVMVDREGTVWITAGSLDSFVSTGLVREAAIPSSPAGYRMMIDDLGRVYVTYENGVSIIRPGRAPESLGAADFEGLCPGRNGAVWISTRDRLRRVLDGRYGASVPVNMETVSCGEDREGRLWRIDSSRTLRVWEGRAWRDMTDRLPVGEDLPWSIVIDRRGDAVILMDRRYLVKFDGLRPQVLSNAALGVGPFINSVQDGPSGLIVAGTKGLARIRPGQVQRLNVRDHPWLNYVSSISWGPNGVVWIMSRAGLVRLSAADLDKAFDLPGLPIPHVARRGLPGLQGGRRLHDGLTATLGGDGRFWFITTGGLMQVEPQGLTMNRLAPPVVVRNVMARGVSYDASKPVVLPEGTRNLTINYSALSLRMPRLVRFRYRLEGVDKTWVEAGTRREAIYTNLGPGKHRFQVIAANEDGVWNTVGAGVEVEIPNTFTQTWMFYALCGLGLAGLLWVVVNLRMRVVASRIRSKMTERLAERERIARELHDTLLQGVQGLILRLQVLVEDFPRQAPVRTALETALDDADEIVGEARERVQNLRLVRTEGDLDTALRKLVDFRNATHQGPIEIVTDGAPYPLTSIVCDEILQIVGEALFNAHRHAQASEIRVEVHYARSELIVAVTDDGVGIPDDVLSHGRAGHFGLGGMRERARSIGARLTIEAGADGGTTVTVRIRVRGAYCARLLNAFPLWLRTPHD